VEARNSTRDFGALHPATGSHPSAGGQWNLLCPPRAQGEGGLTGKIRQRIADVASTAPADCRVPLLDPALATGDTARFFAAAERLLGGVPNAVRVWGHVPHVGKLVLPFFVAIERAGCGGVLPPAIKLLVIARTSHINAASYTLAHVLANAHAEGVPEGLMDELATAGCVSSPRISERERAALVWAHHVAQNTAKHHDAVFGELKRHYNDAEIVELTGLCAETNMVNRFCNALRVPIESAESLATLCRAPRVDPARLKTYLATVLADWPQQLPVPDATVV
jgi:alkylhydroperoxidase family enzyme